MVLANTSDGANTEQRVPRPEPRRQRQHVDPARRHPTNDADVPVPQAAPSSGSEPIPSTNGGDDAEVVYHEYGHGMSNRLVTYPDGNSGLDNQQAGSMGEAWSDWYALDFLNQGGYKPDDEVQNGNLVMGELSFNSLLRTQPVDCAPGVGAGGRCPGGVGTGPGGFTYGDSGRSRRSMGISRRGARGRRDLARDPVGPAHRAGHQRHRRGRIRYGAAARDAGDGVVGPPAHRSWTCATPSSRRTRSRTAARTRTTIWQVFADRGMGYFAFSEDGNDVKPVEDFDTPPSCGPCSGHEISGTVTDKLTDEPIQSATVSFPGLGTGFGFSLSDTTAANGTYTITDVPHHMPTRVPFRGRRLRAEDGAGRGGRRQ